MPPFAAVLVSMTALSFYAAPMPKNALPASLGPAPFVELVARGCSPGWHRGHWQDTAGEWHWDRCAPSWR